MILSIHNTHTIDTASFLCLLTGCWNHGVETIGRIHLAMVEEGCDIHNLHFSCLLGWTHTKVGIAIRPVVEHEPAWVFGNVGSQSLCFDTVNVENGKVR